MNKTIKIGGHNYTVEDCESADVGDNWALIQYKNLKIKIDKELTGSRRNEVLTHEIIHGILAESGVQNFLRKKEIDVESLIELFENTFYQFLLENTDFFKEKHWLQESKDYVEEMEKQKLINMAGQRAVDLNVIKQCQNCFSYDMPGWCTRTGERVSPTSICKTWSSVRPEDKQS